MSAYLRPYAAAASIRIPLLAADGTYADGADWTPAAGDVKVSIDGAAQTNITTLPTYTNGDWQFTLSAAELTGEHVSVRIHDPEAAIQDDGFNVETFGDINGMFGFDLSSPMDNQQFPDMTIAMSNHDNFDDAIADVIDACASTPPSSEGTLQEGSTSTVLILDPDTPGGDGFYVGHVFEVAHIDGSRESRDCVAYDADTQAATLLEPLLGTVATTSTYQSIPGSPIVRKFLMNAKGVDASGNIVLYDDDGTTVLLTWVAVDSGTALSVGAAT